jgi:NAD-dependent DNA ligase
MALAEQTAETTVKEVEWNLSRNGLLIPRIIIEPVTIGGATISKVTGHNAKFIVESGLGNGAKILIRRSGDVIPIVDSILVPVEPQMPKGTPYTWDGVHIRPSEGSTGDAAKQLLHSLRVLGVKGAGEAAVEALVAGGYNTIFDIMNASVPLIQTIIGTANGKKIKDNVDAAIKSADLATKILTYPDLPAGIGSTRIVAFVEAGANFDGLPPEGFGEQTWSALTGAKKGIKEWISKFPVVAATATAAAPRRPAEVVVAKGAVATTGFRFDATTKASLEAKGWTIKDSLTKDCKYLIVPELPHESSKTQQAVKYGIPVIAKKTFIEMQAV